MGKGKKGQHYAAGGGPEERADEREEARRAELNQQKTPSTEGNQSSKNWQQTEKQKPKRQQTLW